MSITDKKGINVTSGFKLISPQPIDARMVVEDENELVSIVDSAAAYEGQLVYVKSLDKYVSFDGTQFNELETGGGGAYVEGETLYLNAAESGSSSGSSGSGVVFTGTITGELNSIGELELDTSSTAFMNNVAEYIRNNFNNINSINLLIENNILGNYIIPPIYSSGSSIISANFQFTIYNAINIGVCVIYLNEPCSLSFSEEGYSQYFNNSKFTFKIM